MVSRRTRILGIAAALFGGLLAGGNVDRAFVAMPAWEQVGATAWAEFSRHADLGNGLVLYPFEAFATTFLTLAAAVSVRLDRTANRTATVPIFGAALLCVAGLIVTLKAAPLMLGISGVGDPMALQASFEGFRFWGNIRGACQVLAFAAQLWTLGALRGGNGTQAQRPSYRSGEGSV